MARSRRMMIAGVAAVLVAGGFTIAWGGRGSKPDAHTAAPVPGTPVRVDRPAPWFAQPLVPGPGTLRLAQDRGRVVVVNFWASWCSACRREASSLERLWSSYQARGVRFVGVDYEDTRRAAVGFLRTHGLDYQSVFDPTGTVGDAYGIFGLPMTFVIGTDGHIRYVVTGRIRVASLGAALEALLGAR